MGYDMDFAVADTADWNEGEWEGDWENVEDRPSCMVPGLESLREFGFAMESFNTAPGASLLKGIFEGECPKLAADKALAKRIHNYLVSFINRNEQYSEFFGGHLTGVHLIRFLESDKNRWFDDILEADEESLREKIHALPFLQGEEGVFHVAGDPMNQSCAWLLHKFYSNGKMSVRERHDAMMDVLVILQIKFFTSRLSRYFYYPADRGIAEETYAQLSNKFLIKSQGSWIGVLRYRAEDVLRNTSSHFNAIAKMDDDLAVRDMVNDIQGRIRGMLKNIYAVHLRVKESGVKITTTSSVVSYDGVEVLRDKTKGLTNYSRYLKSIVGDANSLIRGELLKVVENIMTSAPPKHVETTLRFISQNYLKSRAGEIEKMLDAVMVHSFTYLLANDTLTKSNPDLPALLLRLRGVYTSSRSTDPDLMELRELTESIVKRAIQTKTPSVIASVRTAVLLYLVARAYTMRHYTSVGA